MNTTQVAILLSIVVLLIMGTIYMLNPTDCHGPTLPRWAGLPSLVLAAYMIIPLMLAGKKAPITT